jgi:hypothetical protein
MDKIWKFPCYHPQIHSKTKSEISQCYPGWKDISPPNSTSVNKSECPNRAIEPSHQCFRGIHDDIISKNEIDQAIGLGHIMIRAGGDHFDVHYDVSNLQQQIPTVVTKLQGLLQEQYHVFNVQPVAFRIHTVGPMDLYGVNLFQPHAATLNQTVSCRWETTHMIHGRPPSHMKMQSPFLL